MRDNICECPVVLVALGCKLPLVRLNEASDVLGNEMPGAKMTISLQCLRSDYAHVASIFISLFLPTVPDQ